MPDGLMAVHKPAGWTSSDVVTKVRNELQRGFRRAIEEEQATLTETANAAGGPASGHAGAQQRNKRVKIKVGHGGTLDPMATGVLVLGIGSGTKELEKYLQGAKGYSAVGILGSETDTLDSEGQETEAMEWSHVTRDALMQALEQFRGDIMQVPPMYSALRKDGKRLHELARQGKVVERDARPVTIYQLEAPAEGVALPSFALNVQCSGGTYIRTLIADIARALGTRGHMTSLVRTKQGPFGLEHCLDQQHWHFEQILAHLDKCNTHLRQNSKHS
ncbi:pseudouridine synthase [Tribonema minus]|uniref:tRNA pseudouridine(55) synthase n=1 Tax=Tribonema minus TaxID=303371 RepID=A0A835Z9D0_9STRA|nr:pseudouridine synthase [Tribonema minus]